MKSEIHILLLVDRLELNGFVCVLSPARRAFAVEVFLDMMPTEATDLSRDPTSVTSGGVSAEKTEPDNHRCRAGSSGQRCPSPRDRAGILGLPGIDRTGKMSRIAWTGHRRARRANTYCFIVAPVRVLYAREDARLGLYRSCTGLENGGWQGWMSTGSGGHW